MKKSWQQRGTRRACRGSTIAELGPAVWLLLLLIFFPMIDLMGLGVSYGCCAYLNGWQTHEASLVPWNEALNNTGAVQKNIPDSWKNSAMGAFAHTSDPPQTIVTYRNGQTDGNGIVDKIVQVETHVTCNPFLHMPLPAGIPGLTAPMGFVLIAERPMENPDYAKP